MWNKCISKDIKVILGNGKNEKAKEPTHVGTSDNEYGSI
jgi:hypothetical protein